MNEAARLGVKPIRIGDEAFEAVVTQGTIKYVVTESGELVIVPHTVKGVEISNAVASGGRPVISADQAEIVSAGGKHIGLRITPHSGHFLNGATAEQSARALEIAKEAFRKAGIVFE